MEIASVYELAWLTTQQIVVTEDKEGKQVIGFGSGFFLQYKDFLFFVTADHVYHAQDYVEGIRLGKDTFVWVFNNKNSTTELATMLTPIGGLYSFDQYDINDELSFTIPDMKDISFAIILDHFKQPFLTHDLRDYNDDIIVPAGEEKLIINSECATELSPKDYCLVEGCVLWDIRNGIILCRCNAIHQDLLFDKIDNEGYYILKSPEPIEYSKWAGLSGSPVFTDQYRFIGMLIEVNENDDTVRIVPVKKITSLMDQAIIYEKTIKT